jgi:hypothetical protein
LIWRMTEAAPGEDCAESMSRSFSLSACS